MLLEAAFAGERTARPLVSLWRHWPEEDQDPEALGRAHVDFQRRHDFDFVKFTPSGTDCVEDWGVETTFSGDPHGTRDVVKRGIARPGDWAELPALDLGRTKMGRQLEAIRIIRRELGPDVPVFQTVFSPLTVARKLAGDRVADDLRRYPELVHRGLETVSQVMRELVLASFGAGADGLFFATQTATRDLLTDEEHRAFGVAYDLPLLEAAKGRARYLALHAHGSSLMYEQLLEYPVGALNWHDRAVGPSLAEMRERFPGLLMGGIDEWGCLLDGPVSGIADQVGDAVRQAAAHPLCLAAGCVIGYQTPDEHIDAVRRAVHG